jgi:signal peptidase I
LCVESELDRETPLSKKEGTRKAEKHKETLAESISGIAEVLVSGLFIITFVVQSFVIPTGSMENTLLVGDYVFVDRITPALKAGYVGPLLPYRPIRRDEVFVFVHPVEPGMYVVKRVIGLPGDRIHLHDGVVYRNGEALREPYLNPNRGGPNPYRDEFPTYSGAGNPNVAVEWPLLKSEHIQGDDLVVPPGKYFAMGDNRADSLDSRYWGFVPQENIVGRPLFIYWSFETPRDEWQKTSLGERVSRFFYIVFHFFSQTRWNRMFHMVR